MVETRCPLTHINNIITPSHPHTTIHNKKKITRRNFGLALVEKARHYSTHLVNNDGEVGVFYCLTVAMMCEDTLRQQVNQKRQS